MMNIFYARKKVGLTRDTGYNYTNRPSYIDLVLTLTYVGIYM